MNGCTMPECQTSAGCKCGNSFFTRWENVIKAMPFRSRKIECDHPTLERYGKDSVSCTECDRVWRL